MTKVIKKLARLAFLTTALSLYGVGQHIHVKVSDMESLRAEKPSTEEGCSTLTFGSRLTGTTTSGVRLVMSCRTQRIVCGATAEPLDKADDGNELVCVDQFHVGQIVTFEVSGNGYKVMFWQGFDGRREPDLPSNYKQIWDIESESVVSKHPQKQTPHN